MGPTVRVPPGATGGGEGMGLEARGCRAARGRGTAGVGNRGVDDFDQPRGNYYRLVSAIFSCNNNG